MTPRNAMYSIAIAKLQINHIIYIIIVDAIKKLLVNVIVSVLFTIFAEENNLRMHINKFYNVLCLALLMSAVWLCADAKKLNDADVERFYNLPLNEQQAIIDSLKINSNEESAMFYANILVNKLLDKKNLTDEESRICCAFLNYMGLIYMRNYYNYQLGAKYLLKAMQLAQKYDLKWQYAHAVDYMSILNSTKNNLENNFASNPDIIGYFKESFRTLRDYYVSASNPTSMENAALNDCIGNLIYFVVKYDKVNEIVGEIKEYRSIKIPETVNTSYANAICKVAECWHNNQFEEALTCIAPDSVNFHEMTDNDSVCHRAVVEFVRFYLLQKCNRIGDAENQLQKLEEDCRKNGMTFELLEVLNMKQLFYEQQGDEALATKYELMYFTTKDQFIGKSMLGKVDSAELDLKLEESTEQMREMNYRHNLQTVVLVGVIIFALLAVGLLTVVVSKNRKIRKQNEVLYKKNVELLQIEPAKRPVPSAPRTTQDEASQNALLEKINSVMLTSEEIFSDDFSVNRLAELVESNRTYVSQVINDRRHCNFPSLLNEYRIKEACRRLLDTANYGSYTIEGIARSVGYKSRANFVTVFKEITGLTPSAFQKMSRPFEETSSQD